MFRGKDRTEDSEVKIVNMQALDLEGNGKAMTWANEMVLVLAFSFWDGFGRPWKGLCSLGIERQECCSNLHLQGWRTE